MDDQERPEFRFKRALNEALLASSDVKRTNSSREHSLAITNLEQALLWCRADIDKKYQRKAS